MATPTPPLALHFEGSATEDVIKGEPRELQVETETVDSPSDARRLQQICKYERGSKLVERAIFAPDGSIATREIYTYGPADDPIAIRTLSGDGRLLSTTAIETNTDGIRKATTINSEGEELQTMNTKFDSKNRPVELVSYVAKDNSRLKVTYDNQGRPQSWHFAIGRDEPFTLAAEITYQDDGSTLSTYYLPEGEAIAMQRITGDSTLSSITSAPAGISRPISESLEKVEEKDSKGNWTRKLLLTNGNPTKIVYRKITYY